MGLESMLRKAAWVDLCDQRDCTCTQVPANHRQSRRTASGRCGCEGFSALRTLPVGRLRMFARGLNEDDLKQPMHVRRSNVWPGLLGQWRLVQGAMVAGNVRLGL
jgi:hypothetical protein